MSAFKGNPEDICSDRVLLSLTPTETLVRRWQGHDTLYRFSPVREKVLGSGGVQAVFVKVPCNDENSSRLLAEQRFCRLRRVLSNQQIPLIGFLSERSPGERNQLLKSFQQVSSKPVLLKAKTLRSSTASPRANMIGCLRLLLNWCASGSL